MSDLKKDIFCYVQEKTRKKVWKHISKDVQVRLCRTLKHNRILCNSWEVRPNLFPKGYPDGLHIIFFQVYGNSCCLPRKQEGEKKWVQLSQARITAKNVVYSVRDLFLRLRNLLSLSGFILEYLTISYPKNVFSTYQIFSPLRFSAMIDEASILDFDTIENFLWSKNVVF